MAKQELDLLLDHVEKNERPFDTRIIRRYSQSKGLPSIKTARKDAMEHAERQLVRLSFEPATNESASEEEFAWVENETTRWFSDIRQARYHENWQDFIIHLQDNARMLRGGAAYRLMMGISLEEKAEAMGETLIKLAKIISI